MNIDLFHSNIVKTLKTNLDTKSNSDLAIIFLEFVSTIFEDKSADAVLKMTNMSVLFEAFYQSISNNFALQKKLANIRLERWNDHYGTPTLTFLLTYAYQIEKTKRYFYFTSTQELTRKPLEVSVRRNFAVDNQNNVLVDTQSIGNVALPAEDEKAGQLLKTYNPTGGFATLPCDPVSQKFIEFASNGRTMLEIGAAFGAATLQVLAKGATVFCNDIEPRNLAVIRNRHLKKSNEMQQTVTGDDSKLILVPGIFPHELVGLPKNYFDAILICRVLHFFTGKIIEQSLQQLFMHLKPGGKLFVVCETPFLKNWRRFINEYEKKVLAGVKWPGEITTPVNFESSGRAASLPKFVHWITQEILERSLIHSNFEVEYLSYIDRKGQFPDDLLLDGRESIGAVAVKP